MKLKLLCSSQVQKYYVNVSDSLLSHLTAIQITATSSFKIHFPSRPYTWSLCKMSPSQNRLQVCYINRNIYADPPVILDVTTLEIRLDKE